MLRARRAARERSVASVPAAYLEHVCHGVGLAAAAVHAAVEAGAALKVVAVALLRGGSSDQEGEGRRRGWARWSAAPLTYRLAASAVRRARAPRRMRAPPPAAQRVCSAAAIGRQKGPARRRRRAAEARAGAKSRATRGCAGRGAPTHECAAPPGMLWDSQTVTCAVQGRRGVPKGGACSHSPWHARSVLRAGRCGRETSRHAHI